MPNACVPDAASSDLNPVSTNVFHLQAMPESKQPGTIGYYTVCEDERTGWTGGLLILNSAGRPLEFQCTLPVRPSKAHEILFGPTLQSHLIGDVIGPLLVQKCRTPISLLCCDQPESLAVQSRVDAAVALVAQAAEDSEGPIAGDVLSGFTKIDFAGANLLVAMEDEARVTGLAASFVDLPDAVEPFDRIREAIKEAQSQIARQKPSQAA